MVYCEESDVHEAAGTTSRAIQTLSGKNATEVTTMINGYIAKADRIIKRALGVPIKIVKEEHIGDGKTNNIELGPWEDSIGMFDYDPTNCVENVYAIYVGKTRVRLPYPRNCDDLTEDNYANFSHSNCTVSEEATIIKCGSKSIKGIFSAAGYMGLVLSNLKNIEPWDYIGFWFYTSDATATFTFRLYDKDGNYNSKTFTCPIANRWTFIRLYIDEFTGDVDWTDTDLYEFRIYSDKVCTVYFDNFNFNDGWWWTYPIGYVNYGKISAGEGWVTDGLFIEVTYDYDPFAVLVPEDIESCSACLAGVMLLDYVLGLKLEATGIILQAEDLNAKMDRFAMEGHKQRIQKEAESLMAGFGYKAYTGMG